MENKKSDYFLSLICLGALIGGGNWVAVNLNLYFLISWLDSLMHTLTGVFIALALFPFIPLKVRTSRSVYIVAFSVALVVGLLWEYLELHTGVTSLTRDGYILDTGMDLICDVLGAIIGVLLVRSRFQSITNA